MRLSTNRQHCDPNLLVFNDFRVNILEAESVLPEFQGFVDAFCCNAEVVDLHKY